MLSRWNIDSNLNVTSVMLAAKSEHSDNLIQRWVEPRSSCRAYAHLPDITTSTSFQSTSGLLKSTNFASQEQTSDCYPKPVVQSESHALSTNLPMLYRDIEFWKKIHWIPMSLTVITHEKNKIHQRSSLHKARRWEEALFKGFDVHLKWSWVFHCPPQPGRDGVFALKKICLLSKRACFLCPLEGLGFHKKKKWVLNECSLTLNCPCCQCCQCCPYYLLTDQAFFRCTRSPWPASSNNKHRPQACRYPAWARKGNPRWPLQKLWISKATSGFISLWSLTSSNPHFKDPLPKSFCLDHHLQFNPLNHWSRALDESKLVQRMTTYA